MTAPALPLRRSFLRRLEAARDLGFPLFRGVHPRSALSGPPTEFDGHRPYLPGDDTRWIDWNIYARSEDLFVKVFQVEEEMEVAILVDVSLSMREGGAHKGETAAAAASALAYLAFLTGHTLSLLRYAERTVDMAGPYRSLQAYPLLSRHLVLPVGGTGTDLGSCLRPFLLGRRRPVSVVAVTDGFQRRPLEEAAETVRSLGGHRFTLFLLQSAADRAPRLRGRLLLVDPEGQGRRSIISNGALERQVRRRIEAHFRDMEARLRRLGADIAGISCDEPFEEQFMGALAAATAARERVGHGL